MLLAVLAASAALGWDDSNLTPLLQLAAESDDPEFQRDILGGIREGLRGRRSVPMPEEWPRTYGLLAKSNDQVVREHALALALMFGDPQAVGALQKTALDTAASVELRRRALQALVESRALDLASTLQTLLDDAALRSAAIRALAAYPHPQTPQRLLDRYADLTHDEKQDALQTLATRADYSLAILNAVEKKIVQATDISAYTARQLQSLNDAAVSQRLKELWGEVRSASGDKQMQIAKYKALLTPGFLDEGDAQDGRLVYERTCAKCHRLYGEGGTIGPDLTGSNRANLDYVLENALDPSAVIPRDYRMNTVATADGRVLTGIVVENAPEAIVLQTVNEKLVLSRDEVEEVRPSPLSMMPEGQLETLTPQEIRDLVVYLRTQSQVPLPIDPADGLP